MSTAPELACPEGVAVLRSLSFGAQIKLVDGEWRFAEAIVPPVWRVFDRFRLRPPAVSASDVEWLLEDGIAARVNAGLRLVINDRGRLFLEYLDGIWRDLIREMPPTQNFQELVRLAKARFPDDGLGRCYLVGYWVLHHVLGARWAETHVLGDSAPTNFFRNRNPNDRYVGMVRAIHLAEMLLNLQSIGGFSKVLSMIKGGDIEAGFAELEVGKLLVINSRQFKFTVPSQIKREDFDLEIRFGDLTACADTKCKLEDTKRSVGTLMDSLGKARGQLPADRPGIVFVKLPQTWNPDGLDGSHSDAIREVCDKFFRGTGKIVSVVFYFSLTLDFGSESAGYLMSTEVINPNHRFDQSVDWRVLSDVRELPPHWLDLVRICA